MVILDQHAVFTSNKDFFAEHEIGLFNRRARARSSLQYILNWELVSRLYM